MTMFHAIIAVFKTKTGISIFAVFVGLFLVLQYFLNELDVIGAYYVFSLPYTVYVPYVFFTFLNAVLFGISMALMVNRIKQLRKSGLLAGGGLSAVGSFVGLLAGACPGCIAGLFPAMVAIFGLGTMTLMSLPFYGAELQAVASMMLLLGIYFLTRPLTCKVPDVE